MKVTFFDLENWREIAATLGRNKTRTFLTAFGIFWGTAMLALLWGASRGFEGIVSRQFAGLATNMGGVSPGTRSISYRGFNKGSSWNMNVPDIAAIRRTAEQVLPKGYGFEFGGITREESETGSNTAVIFGICILLIYLILSALYESFIIPFAVILSVPCGLMGSFLFARMLGLENNIYLQTGLIMLIGLLAKTAILLTEYAADRRACGMSLTQAAVSAAKVRLRPILMTVLTMVFGMIPLVFASGVGANGNSTLGAGVVGGMIIGTLALLFLVPTLFIVFQTLQEKVKPVEFNATPDWAVQEEIEAAKNENLDRE